MRRFWGVYCANCGLSEYEHSDHAHEQLMNPPFPLLPRLSCPFGDCGNFVSAERRAPSVREGEG